MIEEEKQPTPAEEEAIIRRQFEDVQKNIIELVRKLAFEYSNYDDLSELITEIDKFGADDLFGTHEHPEIPISHGNTPYVF